MTFYDYLGPTPIKAFACGAMMSIGFASGIIAFLVWYRFKAKELLTYGLFAVLWFPSMLWLSVDPTAFVDMHDPLFRLANVLIAVAYVFFFRNIMKLVGPLFPPGLINPVLQVAFYVGVGLRFFSVVLQSTELLLSSIASIFIFNILLVIQVWRSPMEGRAHLMFRPALTLHFLALSFYQILRLTQFEFPSVPDAVFVVFIVLYLAYALLWVAGIIAAIRDDVEKESQLAFLGMYMAEVVHEASNHLMVADVRVRAIAKDAALDEKFQNYSKSVLTHLSAMTAMVNRLRRVLLQLSHDEASQPVEAKTILEYAVEFSKSRIERRRAEFEILGGDTTAWVQCPPFEMAQALTNLLVNAADAVESAPVRKIRLSVKKKGGRVDFTVSDSGPGIPPEIRNRILNPFVTTKARGKGTGIGLSFSRRIVEQYDGTLKFSPDQSRTEFVISLPAIEPVHESSQISKPEPDLSQII